VTLGSYPDLPLAKARQKADELRGHVANGITPAEARKRARAAAASRSFGAIAERYLEEHAKRHKKPSSAGEDERNLNLHILPRWRDRRIDEIDRADVIELAESIVARGTPVLANRLQALASSIFSFAIDADLTKFNPCFRLRKRGAETPATRVLTDDEIRQFWTRIIRPPISRRTGLALRLVLLTAARAGEAAGARRAEFENLDQPGAVWTLPAERSKNNRPHIVPLSDLARETVNAAIELNDDPKQEFVFATPILRRKRGPGPINPHTLFVAMKQLTDKTEGPGAATWKAKPPSPHDLRRTCATRLASLGTPGEDVAACLNHVRRDVTGRTYDRYERLAEKRRALIAWSENLKSILNGGSK